MWLFDGSSAERSHLTRCLVTTILAILLWAFVPTLAAAQSYDGENRLAAVAMPTGTATTIYDPAGRLRQIGAAVTTQLLYDGDAPIAEYNASGGAIINRVL
jgi:YD repeat-containing protein